MICAEYLIIRNQSLFICQSLNFRCIVIVTFFCKIREKASNKQIPFEFNNFFHNDSVARCFEIDDPPYLN